MPLINQYIPDKTFAPGKRLLGLDVGSKTIGVALSDTRRVVATPKETIERAKKFSTDALRLKDMVREFDIGGLVIGYPVNMDGSAGPRCQSIRQFAINLETYVQLPMLLWDERLSTAAVERAMLEADLSRQKRAEIVDKLAASYILQGFLDYIAGSHYTGHHPREDSSSLRGDA